MKKFTTVVLLASTLLLSNACSNEGSIPQPGDCDFIGPVQEDVEVDC